MSVTPSAYSILGICLKKEDLFIRKLEKVGNHDFSKDVLFHPQTGKKLWDYTTIGKVEWVGDEEDDFSHYGLKFQFSDCRDYVYVGSFLGRVREYDTPHASDASVTQAVIDDVQTRIDVVLQDLGIPRKEVRLWTILNYA